MGESPKKRGVSRLPSLWAAVRERHRHIVVGRLNDHEIKVAVNEVASEWHSHPNSDEFFLTLEGKLTIEFRDGETATLNVGDGMIVEAGAVHRTIPSGRTVNLLVERADVTTVQTWRNSV
jgi:mannose-6-phosphate isomerase-like protein (cupin superfamily)